MTLKRTDLIHGVTVDNETFGPDAPLGQEVRFEVIDMLCSGWTPGRIARHIYHTHGVSLPLKDIIGLWEAIPDAALLPPSKLSEKLQQVDLEFDALGLMARLLRINEDRLGKLLGEEDQHSDTLFDQATELAELLAKQAASYVELKMKLGLYPQEAPEGILSLEIHSTPTVGEILKAHAVHGPRPDPDSTAAEGEVR
jgi:hypothetical protein